MAVTKASCLSDIHARTGLSRLVKKLMRLRTRSISEARRAVLDRESSLYAFRLPLTKERAGHSPCPDDSARNDSVPHTRGAHATVTRPHTGSAATDTPPSPSAPTAPRTRSDWVTVAGAVPA